MFGRFVGLSKANGLSYNLPYPIGSVLEDPERHDGDRTIEIGARAVEAGRCVAPQRDRRRRPKA